MRHVTLIIAVIALALAAPAFSGKGGNAGGNGQAAPPGGSCTVDGSVVTATGLPRWTLVNFMVTNGSGTSGWVLGYSDDGTYAVSVPAPDGATTYEFASKTWGPHGSKYDVYATCST